MKITGNGATYDTTDISGSGQPATDLCPPYRKRQPQRDRQRNARFCATQSGYNYSGQVNINSGTVRLNNVRRLQRYASFHHRQRERQRRHVGRFGQPASVGTVTLTSGLITDSVGNGSLTAASFALQSGTVSAVLAGPSATLTKTTAGLVNLTSANTYGGPHHDQRRHASPRKRQRQPGNGQRHDHPRRRVGHVVVRQPWPDVVHHRGTLTAGRTSSPAIDINGSVALQNATISIPTGGTLTVAGNLTFGNRKQWKRNLPLCPRRPHQH